MDKIKISSLGTFDEQKFKKLSSNRDSWLKKGEDMLLSPNTKTNTLKEELKPKMIVVAVKKILKETETVKTIVLGEASNKSLPPFKPGQKIAAIINIEGNFYYTVSKSYNNAINGFIKIKEDIEKNNNKKIKNHIKEEEDEAAPEVYN